MIRHPRHILKSLEDRLSHRPAADLDLLRFAVGQQRLEQRSPTKLSFETSDLKIFSQWGEDGIIQFLISQVRIANETFAEIGVQSYAEANTRFLLMNNNWRGLIVDGDDDHLAFASFHELDWRYDIQMASEFVTAENIDGVVSRSGFPSDLGLLSIDVDGVDYWLWKGLSSHQPRLVVIEYNSVFGPSASVTVPYSPTFDRNSAHWSNVYFGASLSALHQLAEEKGYVLAGCDRSGTNAFFVREDAAEKVNALTPEQAFVQSRFCDTRDQSGNLSYVRDHSDRLALIAHLPVVDVRTGETVRVGSVAIDR